MVCGRKWNFMLSIPVNDPPIIVHQVLPTATLRRHPMERLPKTGGADDATACGYPGSMLLAEIRTLRAEMRHYGDQMNARVDELHMDMDTVKVFVAAQKGEMTRVKMFMAERVNDVKTEVKKDLDRIRSIVDGKVDEIKEEVRDTGSFMNMWSGELKGELREARFLVNVKADELKVEVAGIRSTLDTQVDHPSVDVPSIEELASSKCDEFKARVSACDREMQSDFQALKSRVDETIADVKEDVAAVKLDVNRKSKMMKSDIEEVVDEFKDDLGAMVAGVLADMDTKLEKLADRCSLEQ